MSGQDLFTEMETLREQLSLSIRKLRETGTAYAEAERAYKVRLRQEVLRMRDEGEAIGVISLTCYGIDEVADLRFQRDVAKTVYEANQEAINSLKLQIRIVQSNIEREWGKNE